MNKESISSLTITAEYTLQWLSESAGLERN